MRSVFFSTLLLVPIVALAMDSVTYRIALRDITSAHITGRSVELSVAMSVVNRMYESGPSQEHFEFAFHVPKEVEHALRIHTARVETRGMTVEVEFPDEKSARVFEKFIRENIRSNQTIKPALTAVRFGENFLVANDFISQVNCCPGDGGLS